MKKYVKPDLYFDNFELSVGVASCGIQLTPDGKFKENDTGEKKYTIAANSGVFGTGCHLYYKDPLFQTIAYFGGTIANAPVHNS